MTRRTNSKHQHDNRGRAIPNDSSALALDDGIVQPGKFVRLALQVRDQDGSLVEADKKTIELVIGNRQLTPALEQALIGLRPGERRTIRLHPNDAYGEWDAAKVVAFDRDEFPADVVAGDHFEAERDDGSIAVLRIVEVQSGAVIADMNHQLAGQIVELEVKVESVRFANRQELDVARLGQEKQNYLVPAELVPVGRLLQGRSRR